MIRTKSTVQIGGDGVFTPNGITVGLRSNSFTRLMKRLFANNEQGFFYDPNDLTTMFQDAAGTVPVTTVGQPVGLVLDKSGRNNHAFQTTSASRPILRKNAVTGSYYLEFDGSDDFFVVNSIDFTSTDELNLFAGLRRSSTPRSIGVVLELSKSIGSNTGTFCISAPDNTNNLNSIAFTSYGTSLSRATIPNYTEPSAVVAAQAKISTKTNTVRLNGVQMASDKGNQGTGNYGNYPLYIGRRSGDRFPFNGHIYGLIGIGRLTTDDEIAFIEKELAKRTGVTLNV